MSIRARVALGLALAAVALPIRPAAAVTTQVHIRDFAFDQAAITIVAGTTVAWDNAGGFSHTVTADDASFDSGTIAPGGTFSHTFLAAGLFGYHCAIHPSMTGSVNVIQADGPDLIVSSFAVSDADATTRRVTATVANAGTATADPSTFVATYDYGDAPHQLGWVEVPALAAGQSATYEFFWRTVGKIGTFDMHATADIGDAVAEASEENNTASTSTNVIIAGEPLDLSEPPGGVGARVWTPAAPVHAAADSLVPAHVVNYLSTYIPGDNEPKLPEAQIVAGSKLQFTNLDSADHSLTSQIFIDGVPIFGSPLVAARGGSAEVVGVATLLPGTYGFYCTNHPGLEGTLVVNAAA